MLLSYDIEFQTYRLKEAVTNHTGRVLDLGVEGQTEKVIKATTSQFSIRNWITIWFRQLALLFHECLLLFQVLRRQPIFGMGMRLDVDLEGKI